MDDNDAGHDADTGHDANVMRMLEREREDRADFYKSKDSLNNDNVFSLFGSQFKLLAVVPHRLLLCCLCNPLPDHPSPLLSRHRLSPCAAPLSCWLVVASPSLLLRHHLSCAGWLLNFHLSPGITASLYHALCCSLNVVVAAPPSLPPPACHHHCRGDDRSLSRRILPLLPATSTSLMSTSSTTTSSNPPMITASCPIVQSNPRQG